MGRVHKFRFPLAALVALSAIAATAAPPPASVWQIGPIIGGRNYSVNMPPTPTPVREGWAFDFPGPREADGHVHYLTFDHGPLSGKSRIVMRYRVEARRGTRFIPREQIAMPGTVSLFFQRAGDRWSGKGRYGGYRWYAPTASVTPVAPGTYEIAVRLDDPNWTSVWGRPAAETPAEFRAAIDNAGQLGFVFGSSHARGHGIYATAPARFVLLDFRVL
jgi:hypothetical protein